MYELLYFIFCGVGISSVLFIMFEKAGTERMWIIPVGILWTVVACVIVALVYDFWYINLGFMDFISAIAAAVLLINAILVGVRRG